MTYYVCLYNTLHNNKISISIFESLVQVLVYIYVYTGGFTDDSGSHLVIYYCIE